MAADYSPKLCGFAMAKSANSRSRAAIYAGLTRLGPAPISAGKFVNAQAFMPFCPKSALFRRTGRDPAAWTDAGASVKEFA